MFIRRTSVFATTKLTYEALNRQFLVGAVIASGSCTPSLQTIVNIEFLCHCRVGCALRFLFFLKRWNFFKNNFSFGSALQALLKTLVVCWLVRFLIVLANCFGYVFSCPLNANSNSSFNIGCVFELMNSSFKKQ